MPSVQKPSEITLINLFSTWSLPCQSQAYTLTQLQAQYPNRLTVLGIMLHPQNDKAPLETFKKESEASFFISIASSNDTLATLLYKSLGIENTVPIPLTIVYLHGKLVTYYEGTIPIEMLRHDIEKLLKKGDA
jgi:thiol-disulfide isomerase/thioredoxin